MAAHVELRTGDINSEGSVTIVGRADNVSYDLGLLETLSTGKYSRRDIASLEASLILGRINFPHHHIHVAHAQTIHQETISFNGADAESIAKELSDLQKNIESSEQKKIQFHYFQAVRRLANRPPLRMDGLPSNLTSIFYSPNATPLLETSEAASSQSLPVEELIAKEFSSNRRRPILVLGPGGAGKTTLARHLAMFALDEPQALGLNKMHAPMIVRARDLAASKNVEIGERFWGALGLGDVGHAINLACHRPQKGYFEIWPQDLGTEWILIIDAIDEIPEKERNDFLIFLEDLFIAAKNPRVILTSRPIKAVVDFTFEFDLLKVQLDRLTKSNRLEFVEKLIGPKSKEFEFHIQNQALSYFLDLPFTATLAAAIYKEGKCLPKNRVSLLENAIKQLLHSVEKRVNPPSFNSMVSKNIRQILEAFALELIETQKLSEPTSPLEFFSESLRKAIPKLGLHAAFDEAKNLIELLSIHSGLITISIERNCTEWVHADFMNHLAARALLFGPAGVSDGFIRALDNWEEENWRDVIVTMFGFLSETQKAEFGIRYLIDKRTGLNEAKTTVLSTLLLECLAEAGPISPSLDQEVINILARRKDLNYVINNACLAIFSSTQELNALARLAFNPSFSQSMKTLIDEALCLIANSSNNPSDGGRAAALLIWIHRSDVIEKLISNSGLTWDALFNGIRNLEIHKFPYSTSLLLEQFVKKLSESGETAPEKNEVQLTKIGEDLRELSVQRPQIAKWLYDEDLWRAGVSAWSGSPWALVSFIEENKTDKLKVAAAGSKLLDLYESSDLREKVYEKLYDIYKDILANDENPDTLFNFANISFETEKFESAIVCYDKLVKLSPSPNNLLDRAWCLYFLDRDDLALKDIDLALDQLEKFEKSLEEKNTILGSLYVLRAYINNYMDNHELAVFDFNNAVTLGFDSDIVIEKRLDSLCQLGFFKQVVSLTENVSSIYLERKTFVQTRAKALDAVGRINEAGELWERLMEIDPDSRYGNVNRAENLFVSGKDDQFLEAAKKIINKWPDSYDAIYVTGLINTLSSQKETSEKPNKFGGLAPLTPADMNYLYIGIAYDCESMVLESINYAEKEGSYDDLRWYAADLVRFHQRLKKPWLFSASQKAELILKELNVSSEAEVVGLPTEEEVESYTVSPRKLQSVLCTSMGGIAGFGKEEKIAEKLLKEHPGMRTIAVLTLENDRYLYLQGNYCYSSEDFFPFKMVINFKKGTRTKILLDYLVEFNPDRLVFADERARMLFERHKMYQSFWIKFYPPRAVQKSTLYQSLSGWLFRFLPYI